MKVSDIIMILMFIIPGVICEKISYAMDLPSVQKRSEFIETINGVAWSFPIVLLSGFIINLWYGFKTIHTFFDYLNKVTFLSQFILIIILCTVVLGVARGLLNDYAIVLINGIRNLFGKINIDNKCSWRKLFLDRADSQYVEITRDGETYKGFIKSVSLPNEEKEIVLYTPESWEDYPGIEDKFTKVINTYINIDKNIIIKEYDTTEYNLFCEEQQKGVTSNDT